MNKGKIKGDFYKKKTFYSQVVRSNQISVHGLAGLREVSDLSAVNKGSFPSSAPCPGRPVG